MTIIDVIIQGIIQGITEFLPVSSSGHLSIYQYFFGVTDNDSILLTIVLHLGTLLAVFIMFRKTIWEILKEFCKVIGDMFHFRPLFKDMNDSRRMLVMVFIATVPLIGAYFLSDIVKTIATDRDIIIEGVCFLVTGFLLFLAFSKNRGNRNISDMNVTDALIIGVVQMIAVTPGISRSGSTAAAGALRKLNTETVISFSFILGIPAILAAAASEFMSVSIEAITPSVPLLIIGFITSAVFGMITIGLLRWLMRKERYTVFAYYLFLIGSITVTVGILEKVFI